MLPLVHVQMAVRKEGKTETSDPHSGPWRTGANWAGPSVCTQGWRSTTLRAMVSTFGAWVQLPLTGTKGSGPNEFKIQGRFYPLSMYVLSFLQRREYGSHWDRFRDTEEDFRTSGQGLSVSQVLAAHTGISLPSRLAGWVSEGHDCPVLPPPRDSWPRHSLTQMIPAFPVSLLCLSSVPRQQAD